MKYGYLAVEGPHDLAFSGKLLKLHGLDRVKMKSRLDAFWLPLVPTKFPHQDDLLARMPVPTFFVSTTHSIAVHVVGGDSKLSVTIKDSLDVLYTRSEPPLTGLGVLLDADKNPPAKRHSELSQELGATTYPIPLTFPLKPGAVSSAPTHCGVFVLPDNQSRGTLEALLLECAKSIYPTLERAARTYVDLASGAVELVKGDRKDLDKPSGHDKAMVACIAAVLRPGKAIQVSIQDNRWLDPPLARFPRIAAIDDFFVSLFEL